MEETEAARNNEPVVEIYTIGETAVIFTTKGQRDIDAIMIGRFSNFGAMEE